MSVRALVRHHSRVHRVPLVPLALGLALFEWIMTFVARQPAVSRFLETALAAAPPQLLELLNPDLAGSVSARGILGIGYTHPFVLLMMGVWAVRVPCSALAGEIGRGTMDLIAARPVSRPAQVAASLVALLGGLSVLALAAWAGTFVGLLFGPVAGASAPAYLPVAAAMWLQFAAWGSVAIAVSALAREAGHAIGWAAGLMAGSYVLDYAARVWPRIASLRPASLFRYYDPQQVMTAGLDPRDAALLAAVALAALLVAFLAFARRDL